MFKMGLPASFEEFWDSEAPRIGEVGARGWYIHVQSGDLHPSQEEITELSKFTLDERNIFQSWSAAEKQRWMNSRHPARTIDELQDDDPYRVVFFSDIKDFLICLPKPSFQLYLINAFLAFCHLPPLRMPDSGGDISFWWTNSFVRTEALEQSDTYLSGIFGRGKPEDSPEGGLTNDFVIHSTPVTFRFPNFFLSTETLFAKVGRWFNWPDSWKEMYSDGEGPVDLSWIRRILRSLVNVGVGGPLLSELYLALEWINSPERLPLINPLHY